MGSNAELVCRIDALVDEHRTTCLWFLKGDYYPRTDVERVQVLDAIQRHGGLTAHKKAAELKQWLLPTSSARSVSS